MSPPGLRFPTGAIGSQCGGRDVVATGGSVNLHIGERMPMTPGAGRFSAPTSAAARLSGAAWPERG
jgi:hypothetical protein